MKHRDSMGLLMHFMGKKTYFCTKPMVFHFDLGVRTVGGEVKATMKNHPSIVIFHGTFIETRKFLKTSPLRIGRNHGYKG
jgi:hypothetical protein